MVRSSNSVNKTLMLKIENLQIQFFLIAINTDFPGLIKSNVNHFHKINRV